MGGVLPHQSGNLSVTENTPNCLSSINISSLASNMDEHAAVSQWQCFIPVSLLSSLFFLLFSADRLVSPPYVTLLNYALFLF